MTAFVEWKDVTKSFSGKPVLRGMSLAVNKGEVMFIIGTSGVGKSVTIKHLIGLLPIDTGEIWFDGTRVDKLPERRFAPIRKRIGMVFQSSTLFDSMTLAENVALPIGEYTTLSAPEIREVACMKLALVGLKGFEDFYPSQISGGMRKRAGLARAMALDPDILFFDEPSAGLDPISSRLLDDLILALRDALGSTVVVVTHELASIFTIADDSVFLDADTRTMIARGNPKELVEHCPEEKVRRFLTRSAEQAEHPA